MTDWLAVARATCAPIQAPDAVLDVDGQRLHDDLAYNRAVAEFEAQRRDAIARACQRAHVNGEVAPVCFYGGTIRPRVA